MPQLLFPLIIFGLMWVLLVRPQQQRVRRQQALVASLEVGDDVVTVGGIMGRVVALDADEARLEVSPGVVLRLLRHAINGRLEGQEEPAGPEGGTA